MTSALAQELAGDQRLGSSCHICTYIRSLPITEQAEWHSELAKPASVVSHTSVLRALQRRGVDIQSDTSVKRHRSNHA